MSSTVGNAEQEAVRLLLDSWWEDDARSTPLPVDPFALAGGLGIVVNFEWLPSDQSGQIVVAARRTPVITINQFDHLHRQRFTCAHEIGHYIRRRTDDQRSSGRRRRDTFVDYRNTLAGLGIDTEEVFANQFAAALLMPAHLVQSKYQFERLSVGDLAKLFDTSEQAARVRLQNLGMTDE